MKCFVVMGFGQKTDYLSTPPRVLDLNRTYEDIIEPAVKEAGLECIRADKIIHSTVIDKPMYDLLLDADVVIADLSTSNANALYELGVRHALRPHATIVIAENGFTFPFDLNHVSILKYEHLGKEIGFREVMRVRDQLKQKIAVVTGKPDTDSPVFLFLPQLLKQLAGVGQPPPPAATEPPADPDAKSMGELLETFRQAKADVKEAADWLVPIAVLNRIRRLQPTDPYIVQQLALATYKSEQPDRPQALRKAQEILETLSPGTACDAETVGLWGAIHKRLWDATKDPADLSTAVRAYARGYFIKNDYYNAINFAFLLDVRASTLQGDEAVADRVQARRIRREVLTLCDASIAGGKLTGDDVHWVRATKVEACVGLGDAAGAEAESKEMLSRNPPPWIVKSMNDQLAKLKALLT